MNKHNFEIFINIILPCNKIMIFLLSMFWESCEKNIRKSIFLYLDMFLFFILFKKRRRNAFIMIDSQIAIVVVDLASWPASLASYIEL